MGDIKLCNSLNILLYVDDVVILIADTESDLQRGIHSESNICKDR